MTDRDEQPLQPTGAIIVYQADSGRPRLEVRLQDESVWLTQNMMADLYQTSKQNVSLHIQSIYAERELDPDTTVKQYLTVRQEGRRTVRRVLDHFSLEMIIAVGYRVKSGVATRFRQWATARLHEYLVKGFTLDDERLKGGSGLVDYFDELLERIREIRASEARVYQRIREIFALASDYREGEEETQRFFATMQNKMHHAATGMTAAEIIHRRADPAKANMGLTAWKGGRVIKRDVGTAKNYLDAGEIDTLNRITVMFLDQAEFRAQRRRDIQMHDWEALLDRFLRDTELPVLMGPGAVSHGAALEFAHQQYDTFAERRRLAAEADAEIRYVDDLRKAAGRLKTGRGKPKTSTKTTRKTGETRSPRRKGGGG